jgi:hypothetical protein
MLPGSKPGTLRRAWSAYRHSLSLAERHRLTIAAGVFGGGDIERQLQQACREHPADDCDEAAQHGYTKQLAASSTALSASCQPGRFADATLEKAVRSAIGKPKGELSQRDLAALDELRTPMNAGPDLTGIECLTGLRKLRVTFCSVRDLTPLGRLTELRELSMDLCSVRDLSPLESLSRLRTLTLSSNVVADLSPLASLSELRLLDADNNRVRDLSPLLAIPTLEQVRLQGNPVDCAHQASTIAKLRARGVGLALDCAE